MNKSYVSYFPFQVQGRLGRLAFCARMLIVLFFLISFISLLSIFLVPLIHDPTQSPYSVLASILVAIAYLAYFYFNLILIIRRLHDRNHSGWLAILLLIPILNFVFFLYLCVMKGTATSNRYGTVYRSSKWEKMLGWCYLLFIPSMIIFISIYTLPSDLDSFKESRHRDLEYVIPHRD